MDGPQSIMHHLDECARALTLHGVPCQGYQMWVTDDGLVHYWFDTPGTFAPEQERVFEAIMQRYISPTQA